tara:strand:- start:673 stop:840 length:168 start_codon:yes stop_codon:yes gene_type:complete
MQTINRTKEKINDSLKMILMYVEIFEDGEFTPYQLVERIKEQINKINNLTKNIKQ